MVRRECILVLVSTSWFTPVNGPAEITERCRSARQRLHGQPFSEFYERFGGELQDHWVH